MLRISLLVLILAPGLVFADSNRTAATQLCFERYTKSEALFSMRSLQYALTPGLEIKVEHCTDQIVKQHEQKKIYSKLETSESDQSFRERIRVYERARVAHRASQDAPLARETLSISNNPEDSSEQLDVVEGYSIIKE